MHRIIRNAPIFVEEACGAFGIARMSFALQSAELSKALSSASSLKLMRRTTHKKKKAALYLR